MPQNAPPSVPSTPLPFAAPPQVCRLCCWSRLHSVWRRGYAIQSFEPGFTQVQDADAQAHYQMHPAPGLVSSDRPEGCLLSCFDPFATQTVPTVCVRKSGMAVQGPPLRALPVSSCVLKGHRRRPYPVREVGVRILNYLDDWLILAQSREQLGDHRDLVLRHLSQLGLRGQLGKEQSLPCAENLFSQCGVRLGEYDGTPLQRNVPK